MSERHRQFTGIEWHRDGEDISYKVNDIIRNKHMIPQDADKQTFKRLARHYYTLSFTYTLKYDDDVVYFAHSIPYNYSDHLIPFLDKIAMNSEYNEFLRIGTLCHTFAGNDCKMVTITENVKFYRTANEEITWMAKSQAARRLIRLKIGKKSMSSSLTFKRKTK